MVNEYICDADSHYDPETEEEWYDNYRWELMDTTLAPHIWPDPYDAQKWYHLADALDIAVIVDHHGNLTGITVFPGNATLGALPEPGPEYLWETYATIEASQGEPTP